VKCKINTQKDNSAEGPDTIEGDEAEPSKSNIVEEPGSEAVKGVEVEPSKPDTAEDPPSVKRVKQFGQCCTPWLQNHSRMTHVITKGRVPLFEQEMAAKKTAAVV